MLSDDVMGFLLGKSHLLFTSKNTKKNVLINIFIPLTTI